MTFETISRFDERYPALLAQIPDPPDVLFARGDLSILSLENKLAVVGSRMMSAYGARALTRILGDFKNSIVLVSGLAAGVDRAVHEFALARGFPTIGVLGCGMDQVYPKENADLYEKMGQKGLLLSEFPLGVKPFYGNFPRRNRIIAGLSQGVLVIEAAKKSGSLITARLANEFGREVFAVPGSIESKTSEGCHLLISQGAKLTSSGQDIIGEIKGFVGGEKKEVSIPISFSPNSLPPIARDLFTLFAEREKWQIDELAEKLSLPSRALFPHLLSLERDGYLESRPGQWYVSIAATGEGL